MSTRTVTRCDCCKLELGEESPEDNGFTYQVSSHTEGDWIQRFDLCGDCVPLWVMMLEAFGGLPPHKNLGCGESVWTEQVWTDEGRPQVRENLGRLVKAISTEWVEA